MTPFITYREADSKGKLGYYIVQKDYPHILAEISEIPRKKFVGAVAVSSYNLWIIFVGTLRGSFIPSYVDIDKEIVSVLSNMATWFLEQRILVNPSKYKKWKIQNII